MKTPLFFDYGKTEMEALTQKDEVMKGLIHEFGLLEREIRPDLFICLTKSIISQQISTKAAQTITARLEALLGKLKPEAFLEQEEEALRSIGLSLKKISYIKNIASKIDSGELAKKHLEKLSDTELIKLLSLQNGIGVWTAEMTLIFCFQRKDILSYSDLVIRKNLMKAYHLEDLNKKSFAIFKERFSPYGSIASFYLWKMGNNTGIA